MQTRAGSGSCLLLRCQRSMGWVCSRGAFMNFAKNYCVCNCLKPRLLYVVSRSQPKISTQGLEWQVCRYNIRLNPPYGSFPSSYEILRSHTVSGPIKPVPDSPGVIGSVAEGLDAQAVRSEKMPSRHLSASIRRRSVVKLLLTSSCAAASLRPGWQSLKD